MPLFISFSFFLLILEKAQLCMLMQWHNWAYVIKIGVEMHKIIFHVTITFKIVFILLGL